MGAGGNGTDTMYQNPASNLRQGGLNQTEKKPITSKSVSISRNTPTQILALGSASATDVVDGVPTSVEVKNTGTCPAFILSGYKSYSDTNTQASADTRYLHSMLLPNETMNIPVRSVVSSTNATAQFGGTYVDATKPNALKYVAVAAYIDGSGLASGTTATTFNVDDNGGSPTAAVGFFRVGDLIRIENEIMEVTAIADNTGTEAQLTVIRGVHGSTAATHADNTQIRLPFFNAYHDFDAFTTARTDKDGKFKSTNFFGYGRANSGVSGIVPSSVIFKFYNSGYQALGLSGITGSTHSGLAANTTYYFTIRPDGATAADSSTTVAEISFTTDGTNLKFGGKNGVLEKIQAALDATFYDSTNTNVMFERRVSVAIIDGDIRFTSLNKTSSSAIALTAGTSGAGASVRFFAQANGRIPVLADINAAVDARLPDDSRFDPITYEEIPNVGLFAYDDGAGNITGAAQGTINYETGAVNFRNAPKEADLVMSVGHTSVFSGKLSTEATRQNSLLEIIANNPSKKPASVEVRTF